jgi:tRNA threonylcarbamoyl adenosine modification protein (Sua5/YciO/YrdC/YwlC family)
MRYVMGHAAERELGLSSAASAARRGDLVVLPTDSVYGVGTDAFNPAGVERIQQAKGRGRDLAVPVLVGSPSTIEGLAFGITSSARALIEAFWPGALTVVVRYQPSLAWDLGEARGHVALRMPLHPVALELLREVGPLAVTSANRTGLAPATTSDDAQGQLGDLVSVYLDSGALPAGPPSTVVDATVELPVLLRAGAIDLDTLRSVCPSLSEA